MSTKKTIKNAPAAAASNAAPSISPNSNKGKFGAGSGPSSNNANPNKNIKNCHIQTSERVKGTTAQFNRDKTTNPKTPRSDCREERLGVVSRPSVITTASAAVPSQDHNSNRGRSGGGNGGGSGPPPSNSSRYPTDSSQGNNFNRGPEQPTNVNSNNNRNWRQMNSTKYNSKPWQNGPSQAKSTHFNNNNNQRDWRQNQTRNCTPCGRSYHNNNSSNPLNNYRQSSNYHSNRNWQQDRHYQRRTNFRHNTIGDDNSNSRTRISEPTNQNCYNDQRSNSKSNWDKQKEITKELDDKRVNLKEDQEVKNKKPSELAETLAKIRRKSLPDSSAKTTSSNESTDVNSAQRKNNDKGLEKKPEENLSESSSQSKDKPDSHPTYPKIQVRPLTELLEQNKTGNTTKGDRLAENSSPIPAKLPIRPALKISRRSTISHCRDNVVSFNDRLARMDKESLKYIINNSDTIFEEQLQIQARQRICEQISRRLKGIEFEKPKNNPVNEVIEDEIVDATKLPALFLQEIENCFGLEIFANQKTLQDDQEKETNQTKESIGQPEKCTEEKKNESEKSVVESSKVNNENTKELIAPTTALSSFESVRSTLESSNVTKETPKESITTDKAVNKKSYEFSQNSEISIQKYNHKDQVVLVKKTTENLENSLQKDYEVDEVVLAKETTENPHGIDNEKDKVVLAKKTNENTENAQQKDKEKDQVVLAKEVELSKIKRKSSGEDKLDEEPIKKPKETVKSDNKGNESVKENTEKETEPKDMAKQRSSDLMARLKVAEEFNQRLNSNSLLNNDNKKDKKSPQKDNSPDHELVRSPVLDCLEVEIKDEPVFVCSTSPMPTVVISSSDEEDYAENDDDNDDDDDDDEEDGDEDVKTDSDSNSCSSFSKSHYNEELQSGVVINTFEKLILPQLPQQMIERYRKNHSATLYTRLQFIFGVVTSSKHNPQVFSNTEISKIQNNLKETNNRIAIEFLLKEIVNVAASQRGKEEQNGANGITVAKNAESAEVIHQRNQVDVSPTPPPLPVSQNVPLSMQCLRQQPFNLPSIQFGMESSMPRLQLGSCYSLLANGETNTESSYGQDSITQSLLEIDRRLLEYQNRRSFIDEIIMKFQKEKSDLEMLTLELHSRKFLILNTVVTKNPAGGTPSQAATTPTVTPTNSPSPGLESTTTELSLPSSPPVASKPSKEVNRRKKSKRNARRKLRSENEQQETESISIPKPINRIKEDPENEDISLAANSHPPVKKLRITKSNLSQQQQPLAIIPPLPPPPPPPEPIVSSMSIVPPLPPPPTLPDSIANISYSHPNRRESNSDFDYIPSGRLHSISYPITHIRIYKIYIIASSEDGDIYMFNIKNHKLERQITKHSEAITNMYLCKKDSYLYTTSLDGFLKKSSLENLERVMQTVYFKEPLQSIDLAWDLAFIGSRWGNLFTFDVMTNKVMESPLLSTGQSIIAVKATKEGPRKIVILGCKGNFVYMHDATTGLLLRRLTLPNDLNVYSLLLNDGHVYCGTQKNEIFKFDFASGNLVDKVSCGNGAVSMVAYGERYLLVGCYDGYIYVLDKLGCNQMGRFEGAGRMVLALAIAGDKVVTSSKDKSLVVLEIPQQMINTEH